MSFPGVLSLRVALSLLFIFTPLVALIIVGSITLAVRLPQIAEENRLIAQTSAAEMATRVEEYLEALEHRITVLAAAAESVPHHEIYHLLESARGDGFDAIYLVDEYGFLLEAVVKDYSTEFIENIVGTDMSGNQLFREVSLSHGPAWSDTQLSAISGTVTVGVAIPVENSDQIIIGEIPLNQIVSISRFTRNDKQLDLWIVDRVGEVIADTSTVLTGRYNLLNLPIVQAGLSGATNLPHELTYGGRDYFAWAELSESLGWLFVTRTPRGMNDSSTRETVTIIIIGFISTSIIGAFLAPFWAQIMTGTVQSVIGRARMIASGHPPETWPTGSIKEFNQLSGDLEAMAGALVARGQALKEMNEELESRVRERTQDLAASNADLSKVLSNLQMTQNELIEAEKLAALGRLVAGIAHELNTPLGNSKLSLSAQGHDIEKFEIRMEKGLRKSDLTIFLDRIKQTTSAASLNVERACVLVSNFKQVAVDRTASYRRNFRLVDLVSGTLVTLQPSLGKKILVSSADIPERLELDSYPGELGQVLTNLVDNAAKHAFPNGTGIIRIDVAELDDAMITISVKDDGIGMSRDVLEKIFNPFYTTKFGQGGTGLGLHISYNAATNVLGGSLTVESTPGDGTIFTLTIPLVAPEPDQNGDTDIPKA